MKQFYLTKEQLLASQQVFHKVHIYTNSPVTRKVYIHVIGIVMIYSETSMCYGHLCMHWST